MSERCPDCAPQGYGGHKLHVLKGSRVPLWYVECDCGWKPDIRDGSFGRPTWGLAMFAGQNHQRVAMTS